MPNETGRSLTASDIPSRPSKAESAGLSPRIEIAAASVLAIVALAVRAVPAQFPHFWMDEVFTVAISSRPFREIVSRTFLDVHPPLHYFLVRLTMLVGEAMGGWFATLPFLRLTSIVPGFSACLIAWRAARRYWGREAGLAALAIFALSPPLAFLSVDLRNYALTHLALLVSTVLLFRLMEGESTSARTMVGYAAAMGVAVYSHSIALVYWASHVALGAGWTLLRWTPGASRRRAWIALALPPLLYAPWIPALRSQNRHVVNMELDWLPRAEWADLLSTFGFYLPWGPLWGANPWEGMARWLIVLTLLGLAALVALAAREAAGRRSGAPGSAAEASRGDRFWIACAAMALLPIAAAFAASWLQMARIFLGPRYNLLAAPFWAMTLAGAAARLPGRTVRRAAVLAAAAAGATFAFHNLRQRVLFQDDTVRIESRAAAGAPRRGSPIYWVDDSVLPWLGRGRFFAIGSSEALLTSPSPPSETVWLVNHRFLRGGTNLGNERATVLEHVLNTSPSVLAVQTGLYRNWAIWRLPPEGVRAVADRFAKLRLDFGARRDSIPGGQTLLPVDDTFRPWRNRGWGGAEWIDDDTPFAWTVSAQPRLEWEGPGPGEYIVRANFSRPLPYPEPVVTVRMNVNGVEGAPVQAAVGPVALEGRITLRRPGETIVLAFQIETWRPLDRITNSIDRRRLGMALTSVEVIPADAAEAQGQRAKP